MKQSISNLIDSFSKIRTAYSLELQKQLGNETFSPNEISILIFLDNNPSISTSRELVYFLNVSKGLISRSIDSLSRKGYVECKVDEKDHRCQHILLTKKSQRIVQTLQTEINKINEKLLEDISEKDIECTQKTIEKILNKFLREELK